MAEEGRMRDVHDLLERAVSSYRPRGTLRAVEARVRRRKTARRISAAVVALAMTLVPGWLAWSGLRERPRPPVDVTQEPVRYSDPLGWSAEVPPGWQVTTFGGFDGRRVISGAAISTAPLRPTEDGTFVRLGDLEPAKAAVVVFHAEGGPFPDLLEDDSTFPLRWEDLVASKTLGTELDFRARGLDFVLGVTVGPEAPSEVETAARRVVASIAPLPLHEGELLASGYLVVRADLVGAVGSAVVVETVRGPFLLIHAPGGFYALGLPRDAAGTFAWDEEAREVVWGKDGEVWARFDREGRVVLAPPAADVVPLEPHPVVRAFDGAHLLLHPGAAFGALPRNMWG